jgi:hypothetical protein
MSHGRASVSRDFGGMAGDAATSTRGRCCQLLLGSWCVALRRDAANGLTLSRENMTEKNQSEEERSQKQVCCERERRSLLDVAGRSVAAIPDWSCEGKKHLGL